ALEDVVRLQADFHIQVARRTPIDARLAIAAGADAHAVVYARGNLDLQGLVLPDAAHALACRAGVGNDLAAAMAGWTCLLNTEEALLHAHCARAAARRAGLGLGAGFGSAAMAG